MTINYTTGIPTALQSLGITQQPIQNNFSVINTAFGIDHVPFNSTGVASGNHKYVHLLTQSANPTIASNLSVLYTKTVNSHSEIFYRYGSSGNIFQITNNGASSGNPGFTGIMSSPGLPMIMVWGQVSSNLASGKVTVPGINNGIYSVMLTPTGGTPNGTGTYFIKSIGTPTLADFNWGLFTASNQYTGFYWLVIGS